MANKIFGYTVVSYPESMPPDWETRLQSLPFGYCYALHDQDLDDGTGEKKKPHMHFYFQGKATSRQKKYIQDCLAVHYGEDVKSAVGMFAYLTHENNPDKHHYDKSIIQYSGKWCQELFEVFGVIKPDSTTDIMTIIDENGYTEYIELLRYVVRTGKEDLIKEAKKPWVKSVLDSKRHSERREWYSYATGKRKEEPDPAVPSVLERLYELSEASMPKDN